MSTRRASWSGAQGACQSINGTLVTISDSSVKSFVYSLLSYDTAWIGAFRPSGGGSYDVKDGWQWDDGRPWGTFNDWASGQPGGHWSRKNCALRMHGMWHNSEYNCEEVHKYVCQKKCKGNFLFLTIDIA